ncbi:HDOD domain-containing protein [Rhodocyclus tenuis]|uniref:histidine kinase n=1 Tax=Rhodocyclus gracilis TaxID=2929842 RepID=A0ABX0WJH2_9RHOO|nr:HDOD domain-containing protein [Rhodocyclus gracilis]NJA88759.1 HDOD domain-containing protein [Rhodocyclus gracilis]
MSSDFPVTAERAPDSAAFATGFIGADLAGRLEGASLPSLPQVLLRVLALTDDDGASFAELAGLIGRDPGLSARVLSVANAPALRRGREFRRIDDCLTVLGTRFVRSMAACLAVQSAFDEVARQVECDLAGFWVHALEVAELARAIAQASGLADADEAYLAGLLHDTGQLVLLNGVAEYPGLLARLYEAHEEDGLCAAERQLLGVHHGAVGAWLIDQWQIAPALGDAVLFHHESVERIADAEALARVLWAAHAALATGDSSLEFAPTLLALPADSLASLRTEARQRIAGIAAALGVDGTALDVSLPLIRLKAAPPPPASPIDEMMQGMAFAQPLQASLFAVSSDEELMLTVRESARILFGLHRMGMLLVEPEHRLLSGSRVGGQSALLRRLEISLVTSPSLAAQAALQGLPLCSFDGSAASLSVTDIQILRALGGDGLLCVPLIARRQCLGMLLFGIAGAHWPRVERRLTWLSNFARIVAASIDSSREARAREQANEEALASRYRLRARQVAHEAGNPLAIIRNYLKLLERKLSGEGAALRELTVLDEEIARVAGILQAIGEPATRESGSEADAACALRPLIEELLDGYRQPLFAARGIELKLDLPLADSRVRARRDPLIQILLNLWKNAAEAMPEGGCYTIELVPGAYEGERRWVELRLHDSGPGLPPETWARLSSGQVAEGGAHGLGLSIVSELVSAMGGCIVCSAQPGRGTLFSIHLPAAGA